MAAKEVFDRFGYRKASVEEVARVAGVSRQCVYGNFANKAALFQAVTGKNLDQIRMRISKVRETPGHSIHETVFLILDEVYGSSVSGGRRRWETVEVSRVHTDHQASSVFATAVIDALEFVIKTALSTGSVESAYESSREVAEVLVEASCGIASTCIDYEDYSVKLVRALRVILPASPQLQTS